MNWRRGFPQAKAVGFANSYAALESAQVFSQVVLFGIIETLERQEHCLVQRRQH